jgi:hypothetical protein
MQRCSRKRKFSRKLSQKRKFSRKLSWKRKISQKVSRKQIFAKTFAKTKISTNTYAKILLFGIIIFWPDFSQFFGRNFCDNFCENQNWCKDVRENENFRINFRKNENFRFEKTKIFAKRNFAKFRENYLIFAWFSLFAKMLKTVFVSTLLIVSLDNLTFEVN